MEKLAARVAKLRGGAPWDAGVDLTPLPEPGEAGVPRPFRAAPRQGHRCRTTLSLLHTHSEATKIMNTVSFIPPCLANLAEPARRFLLC